MLFFGLIPYLFFQLRSTLRVFISLFLISIRHFYFATLGNYHFAHIKEFHHHIFILGRVK